MHFHPLLNYVSILKFPGCVAPWTEWNYEGKKLKFYMESWKVFNWLRNYPLLCQWLFIYFFGFGNYYKINVNLFMVNIMGMLFLQLKKNPLVSSAQTTVSSTLALALCTHSCAVFSKLPCTFNCTTLGKIKTTLHRCYAPFRWSTTMINYFWFRHSLEDVIKTKVTAICTCITPMKP